MQRPEKKEKKQKKEKKEKAAPWSVWYRGGSGSLELLDKHETEAAAKARCDERGHHVWVVKDPDYNVVYPKDAVNKY